MISLAYFDDLLHVNRKQLKVDGFCRIGLGNGRHSTCSDQLVHLFNEVKLFRAKNNQLFNARKFWVRLSLVGKICC